MSLVIEQDISVINPQVKPKFILITPQISSLGRKTAIKHELEDVKFSREDYVNLPYEDYIDKTNQDYIFCIGLGPKEVAIGTHLLFKERFKITDDRATTLAWYNANEDNRGKSSFKNNLMYFILYKGSGYKFNTPNENENNERLICTSSNNPGLCFNYELYNYFESLGKGPYLHIFPRKKTKEQMPKHWYIWEPTKSDVR